ncbi:EID1-like F-box protein 2 isoform B [Glycine soja]|nr:EID1-like F-box protein 2 isoform A [Glycine soja]RZB71079.1 EID1-like F-box protein 2 isoform B [Glycine soja]
MTSVTRVTLLFVLDRVITHQGCYYSMHVLKYITLFSCKPWCCFLHFLGLLPPTRSLSLCIFAALSVCCSVLFVDRIAPTQVKRMILTKQYRCVHSASCQCTKGHLSEDVIFLVFQHLNWNPKLIAALSCVCKWFDDLSKQVLWKEFCKTRAPKMMLDLQSSGSHSVDGNWRALGKLLIFCSGCRQGSLFNNVQVPGHFVNKTRFSRTSGKSFLMPQCINDVLYVSDPCEHIGQSEEGDLGFFRGIFKSFASSNVRRMLINRGAQLHQTEICPYCKAKLWSMLQANMIPQTASCRLGSYEDYTEYYVCLNGHLLGVCTLLPLSDSEDVSEE